MQNKNRILIIEDDIEIARVITINIEDTGMECIVKNNGREGLIEALNGEYDLLILDIYLPEMDGLSVCREIRKKDSILPIIMLTAKTQEIDRVVGLEIGADDYMTKPFSIRELIARVKAQLRRSRTCTPSQKPDGSEKKVILGPFVLDPIKRKAILNGNTLELTVKEYELLDLFLRNPGRTYSRNDLLQIVWGYQYEGYEHTVNSHINRLRAKIEIDPGNPKFLLTVWGIGYRFIEIEELPSE